MLVRSRETKLRTGRILIFCIMILTANLSAETASLFIGLKYNSSELDLECQYSYPLNKTVSIALSPRLVLAGNNGGAAIGIETFTVTKSLEFNDVAVLDVRYDAEQSTLSGFDLALSTNENDSLASRVQQAGVVPSARTYRQTSEHSTRRGEEWIPDCDRSRWSRIISNVVSLLKVLYLGKATYDGYKDDKAKGAIKNLIVSKGVIALSDAASDNLMPKSAVLSTSVSRALFSIGNALMYGQDVHLYMGIGQYNVSQRTWQPADLRGGVLSDIQCVLGYMTVAEDIGRFRPFRDVTAKEMKVRQLEEGGPRPGEPDLRDVDIDKIREVTSRRCDAPYQDKYADNDGNLVSGEGGHVAEYRFGGNLHLDRRESGWVWHFDEFGSWRVMKSAPWVDFRSNPLTGLHHILLEGGTSKKVLGSLPYNVYRHGRLGKILGLL